MSNTIIELKHSLVSGNTPLTLANGEISINTADGRIFYKSASGVIERFDRYPGPSGLNGEIQFNDYGELGAVSNLAFDKSTSTLSVDGSIMIGDTNVYDTLLSSFSHANGAFDKANSAYYPLWENVQDKPDPTITVELDGVVIGNANTTLANLTSGTITLQTTFDSSINFVSYSYGSTPPESPVIGSVWYNWNNGFHYIYTIDSNLNEYWLQLGSSGGSGSINYLTESDVITVSNTSISTYNFNYNTNYIQVFINRLKLRKSEFVANTGTDITINIELVEGDEIEFVTSDLYPIPQ